VQVRQLERQVTLDELKQYRDGPLASMALFTTARLSVQPVSQDEWDFVLSLEKQPAPAKS
jgi:predicted RNA-binding protein with PUA-like domain